MRPWAILTSSKWIRKDNFWWSMSFAPSPSVFAIKIQWFCIARFVWFFLSYHLHGLYPLWIFFRFFFFLKLFNTLWVWMHGDDVAYFLKSYWIIVIFLISKYRWIMKCTCVAVMKGNLMLIVGFVYFLTR